jgi:hypothetical protein
MMKRTLYMLILGFGLVVAMASCKNKSDATPANDSTVVPATPEQSMSTQATPATQQAHFICSKDGCTGSGEGQGKCPVCGSDLVHNQAYHNQAPTGNNTITIDPATGQPVVNPSANPTQTPPPAQNAAGVFHFTCSKAGCDGGAGAAGKCPKCGSELAHNQAYHN